MLESNKVYNEDCLKTMAEIPNESIDTIFADLPFYQPKQEEIADVKYSGFSFQDKKNTNYAIWNTKLVEEFYRILKDGGNLVIVNAPKYIYLTMGIYLNKFVFRSDVPLIRRGSLRPAWSLGFRHNIMVFLCKGDKKLKWYGAVKNHDKTQPTDVWDDIPYQNGYRSKGKRWHPEAINYPVVERALKLTTKENDLIYDPFMGSGTTAEFAVLNNRNFIGSEMSEKYFEIVEYRIKLAQAKEII